MSSSSLARRQGPAPRELRPDGRARPRASCGPPRAAVPAGSARQPGAHGSSRSPKATGLDGRVRRRPAPSWRFDGARDSHMRLSTRLMKTARRLLRQVGAAFRPETFADRAKPHWRASGEPQPSRRVARSGRPTGPACDRWQATMRTTRHGPPMERDLASTAWSILRSPSTIDRARSARGSPPPMAAMRAVSTSWVIGVKARRSGPRMARVLRASSSSRHLTIRGLAFTRASSLWTAAAR